MMQDSFFKQKRKWSKIKDEVLQAYLSPYLAKVVRTRKPIIIADCFAGKGAFDNGEPGSPLLISDAVAKQRSIYYQEEIKAVKAVFIEKKYYRDLRKNVPDEEWIHILNGDYEGRMEYYIEKHDSRGRNLFFIRCSLWHQEHPFLSLRSQFGNGRTIPLPRLSAPWRPSPQAPLTAGSL